MGIQDAIDKLQKQIGSEIGVSDWLAIDQWRVNQFAECTGDFQWIHVDEQKAAEGPFGKTIAHGFLTLSLLPYLSEKHRINLDGVKVTMGINYGMNKVRLLNPVPVGSEIRLRSVLKEVSTKGEGRILITKTETVEIKGQEKPACVAETLAMVMVS